MAADNSLALMQHAIWHARVPLEISIAPSECRTYDQANPYLTAISRLSYLPTLLPQLVDFFAPVLISDAAQLDVGDAVFLFDDIPLRWHLPVGLLYDIYVLSTRDVELGDQTTTCTPFRLTLHLAAPSEEIKAARVPMRDGAVQDAYINAVKEADFLRSGTAKPIMSLSAVDSKALWTSAIESDLATFLRIHERLIPPRTPLRNIPLRVYIPASDHDDPQRAQIKALQAQFSPAVTSAPAATPTQLRGLGASQVQTVGTALHGLLPALFPSRKAPILARPMLHGAFVPMASTLEDLARSCSYADGWLNLVITMST